MAQYPAWIGASSGRLYDRSARFPRVPFQDVLAGQRMPLDPGGLFSAGRNVLPSMQRFNRLMPSEQQGYTGYLEDELGVYSDDVYDLMRRLAPARGFTSAPRWIG